MIKVSELSPRTFPLEFLEVLPTECETCGHPTVITETLSSLHCSNPQCLEKSVQRLVTMLQDMDVKDMGESKCESFLRHFEVNNPYAILVYEPTDGPLFNGCSQEFSEKFYKQLETKRSMLLWEYIKIGNLPKIRDSARKIFAEYDDLAKFYEDFEDPTTGGTQFIQKKLGIKGKLEGESIMVSQTCETLRVFKEDLFEALDYVNIKKLNTPVINLCISTSVGAPYKSKKDFVSQMNEKFEEKIHLNFLSSVTQDTQFLIWSGAGAVTSKVKKAQSINEKRRAENIVEGRPEDENLIGILSGSEFHDYLESL